MPSDRPHFQISREIVRSERLQPTGRSKPYVRADYGSHGRALLQRVTRSRREVAETRDSTVIHTVFLALETPEERPIRSERQKLKDLGFRLMSYASPDSTLGMVSISPAELDGLEARIHRYATQERHPNRSTLSILEDVRPVAPEEKLDGPALRELEERECVLTLFSNLPRNEAAAVLDRIQRYAMADLRKPNVDIHLFEDGLGAARVSLSHAERIQISRAFASVQSVTLEQHVIVVQSTHLRAIPTQIQHERAATDQVVGVVDSGVSRTSPLLAPLVAGSLSMLPRGAIDTDRDHGTFVASRVAFGDNLEAQLASGTVRPVCRLWDVAVVGGVDATGLPIPSTEYDIATALESVIDTRPPNTRVFNLSLGFQAPTQPGRFSFLGSRLDQLALSRDVVFVVSAGNYQGADIQTHPLHFGRDESRFFPPADSLLATSVGSFAKYDEPGALSTAGTVSPFSRRGPGCDGGVKPELVAHGGNLLADRTTTSRIAVTGIQGDGTSLGFSVGTSHSAPLVSQLAARLFAEYPGATGNLIKALLYHFARQIPETAGCPVAHDHLAGFGEPQWEPAVRAPAASAAYLFQGAVRKDTYQYVPFFIPSALGEARSDTRLRVRVTLVYDPPTEHGSQTEYSKARMTLTLRKALELGARDVSVAADEATRNPYSPVLAVDKTFRRSYATGDWECRVRLITRDLPEDYEQRYALVIEVLDDLGGTDVRQEILREAGARIAAGVLSSAAA